MSQLPSQNDANTSGGTGQSLRGLSRKDRSSISSSGGTSNPTSVLNRSISARTSNRDSSSNPRQSIIGEMSSGNKTKERTPSPSSLSAMEAWRMRDATATAASSAASRTDRSTAFPVAHSAQNNSFRSTESSATTGTLGSSLNRMSAGSRFAGSSTRIGTSSHTTAAKSGATHANHSHSRPTATGARGSSVATAVSHSSTEDSVFKKVHDALDAEKRELEELRRQKGLIMERLRLENEECEATEARVRALKNKAHQMKQGLERAKQEVPATGRRVALLQEKVNFQHAELLKARESAKALEDKIAMESQGRDEIVKETQADAHAQSTKIQAMCELQCQLDSKIQHSHVPTVPTTLPLQAQEEGLRRELGWTPGTAVDVTDRATRKLLITWMERHATVMTAKAHALHDESEKSKRIITGYQRFLQGHVGGRNDATYAAAARALQHTEVVRRATVAACDESKDRDDYAMDVGNDK